MSNCIIDARRTHQLAYNYTLRPVDYERTRTRHQRQITHEYLVLVDLICLFVMKSYPYLKWRRIGGITFFTLFNRVFHVFLTQSKVNKFQAQMTAVIGNRGNVIKYFVQPFIQEPLVGILLDFNQIRHLKNFFLSGIAHA